MANTLRFKRGLVSGIPTAALGEPLFTTDTFDLYIGNGTGNTRFQKYIASGTTSQLLRGDGSLLTMPIVLTSPSNGQVLKYDGTNWVNSSDAGVTGSGAAGQVTYWNGTGTIIGDTGFTYDATNKRIKLASTGGGQFYLEDTDATSTFNITDISNNGGNFNLGTRSSAGAFVSTDYQIVKDTASSSYHRWFTAASTERMRLFNTGNLVLNSTTDNGLRFQVTGDGYFSGSVGVGSSALTSIGLRVAKTITGGTLAYAVLQDGQVQSDVTNQAHGFYNTLSTQATSFTLSNYYHYRAFQGTIGAGSAVTNQYGFFVQSNLTGATSNYGFYGDIASGTGRWNLYMNGTAANYLAGNTGIGTNNIFGGVKLQVSGVAFVNNSANINYVLNSTGSHYGFIQNDAANKWSLSSGTSLTGGLGTAALTWFSTGNVSIGNLSDNGLKFQVTGDGYFSGSVGIGTSTFSGYNLVIGKNISGGASIYSVSQSGTVQTDVTTNAGGFINFLNTAASTNVTSYYHYRALQNTIGAGTTIANQFGFHVADLTTAVYNHAFYGNVSSGSNKWNLYMNGSASNHINGSLAIGTTTFNDNVNPYKAVVFYATSGSGGGGLMVTSNQAANGANAMVSAVQWGLNNGSVSKPSGLFFNYSNTTHGNRAIDTVGNLISKTLVAAANLSITNNNGYIQHVDLNSTSNDYVNYQAYLYVQRNSGTVNVNSYTSFRSMYQTAVGSETITDIIDFRAAQPTLSTGALVTNRYGLLIDFNNTQVTNAWGVYQSQSTVNNYMNGALLIGTTTVGTFKLDVNGTMRVSGASTFTATGASVKLVTTADSAIWNEIANSGRTFYLGLDNTAGSSFGVSGASVLYSDGSRPMVFFTNSIERFRIASTGAATFSSSLTVDTDTFFVDATNNRVGVGTITPSYKAHIVNNASSPTYLALQNTTAGSASAAIMKVISDASSGSGEFLKKSSTGNTYKVMTSNDLVIYNDTAGDIDIFNDHANGKINLTSGGSSSTQLTLDTSGRLGFSNNSPTAYCDLAASTTAIASLRIRSGSAPTAPNDGDIWFDGTDLKIRVAGVTKTFTLV